MNDGEDIKEEAHSMKVQENFAKVTDNSHLIT